VKHALVTGGARGIGAAIAQALARESYRVLVNSRALTGEAQALRDTICAGGGSAEIVLGDVRAPSAIAAGVEACGCAQLDVLVNNAGVVRDGLLATASLQSWKESIETNFWGAVRTFEACRPLLLRAPRAVVVSIGSISGIRPRQGHGAYCVSKAMLGEWTRAQARSGRYPTVRFFGVSPGAVDTEMLRATPWYADPAARSRIPLGRYATAEEIAGWVAFLSASLEVFADGAEVVVDGGMTRT
jgi:3-oxoacyl-[acyl-carrier protein] reductase